MLILIWRYSRALIHYELEYLLYNCTYETIDNMADFTKIQSSSYLSYVLSLVGTGKRHTRAGADCLLVTGADG